MFYGRGGKLLINSEKLNMGRLGLGNEENVVFVSLV